MTSVDCMHIQCVTHTCIPLMCVVELSVLDVIAVVHNSTVNQEIFVVKKFSSLDVPTKIKVMNYFLIIIWI